MATTEKSDGALLEAFRQGDSEAFVVFVERHHDAILRWARHMIGPRPEVEDIVQETFLAVLKNPDGLGAVRSARAWLFGVTRNRVARQYRRRAHEPATFEAWEDLGLRAGWGDPELSARRAEDAAHVREALARLRPEAREVLIVRDVEGFTTTEAADILGVSSAAVKSRLHRARLALMAELRREEVL